MKKNTLRKPFLIIGIVILVAVVISWFAFPDWRSTQGGVWLLLVATATGVLTMAKDVVSIVKDLKGMEDKEAKDTKGRSAGEKPELLRTQDMVDSEDGEQSMKGKGGVMKQKMKNSPGGKQRME